MLGHVVVVSAIISQLSLSCRCFLITVCLAFFGDALNKCVHVHVAALHDRPGRRDWTQRGAARVATKSNKQHCHQQRQWQQPQPRLTNRAKHHRPQLEHQQRDGNNDMLTQCLLSMLLVALNIVLIVYFDCPRFLLRLLLSLYSIIKHVLCTCNNNSNNNSNNKQQQTTPTTLTTNNSKL